MTNGFYDLSQLKSRRAKADFLKDALLHSYQTNIQTKYKVASHRTINNESSVNEFLANKQKLKLNCVDRDLYYKGVIRGTDGEVTAVNDDWDMLYCYMSLENLNKLVKKYKLKLKEW